MGFFNKLVDNDSDVKVVDDRNRFNYLLQTMMSNRWKITLIVLCTFFFIVFGIVMAVLFKATIAEAWKELLLILLGAFVGNLNKVIDFYFSSEDRDKMLIQKMDEEDGNAMSNVVNVNREQSDNMS